MNRESRLYLTLPLILSVNKAIESAPTAVNLAWAGLADTCPHLLNSADLLSLYSRSRYLFGNIAFDTRGAVHGREGLCTTIQMVEWSIGPVYLPDRRGLRQSEQLAPE